MSVSTKATVYLLCGKTGSGKTTFAMQMEKERRAIRLSVDDLMLPLFGPSLPRAVFEERLAVCKEFLLSMTTTLLAFGCNVVLDWGFWRKAERSNTRERLVATGACCELIYFDIPDDQILERIRRRNGRLTPGTYEISDTMFEELGRLFEPPGEDEVHMRRSG